MTFVGYEFSYESVKSHDSLFFKWMNGWYKVLNICGKRGGVPKSNKG